LFIVVDPGGQVYASNISTREQSTRSVLTRIGVRLDVATKPPNLAPKPLGDRTHSRIDIVRGREIWRITADVACSLGLIDPHPIDQHPSRENEVVPVNPTEIGRHAQIEYHVLSPEMSAKRRGCREIRTDQGLLRDRARTDLHTRVGGHARATNLPRRIIVVCPEDVSVVTGLILESVDGEAPAALSVTVLLAGISQGTTQRCGTNLVGD
jgi:hypothetical protein